MKHLFLVFIFILTLGLCAAQSIGNYSFSSEVGTYTEISGGASLGNESTANQYFVDPSVPLGGSTTTGPGFPIGFDFYHLGQCYDRVAVSAEGWISLGHSSLTPSTSMLSSSRLLPISSTSGITPNYLVTRISALAIDLGAQAGSTLRVETMGSAPNRMLVVQWKHYRKSSATGDSFNFQIRLHENGNIVSIMYGSMISNATASSPQIGLRGSPSNTATNYRNRTTTTDWASTTEGASATATCTLSAAVYPATGTTFIWTPPVAVGGSYSIAPSGDFTTFTAAINFLNNTVAGAGLAPGGITFNVAAGNTFIETPPAITLNGWQDRRIVFQKSGVGINPILKSAGSTGTQDACIQLSGASWYTFDGIDLANTDGGTAVEYGYFLSATSDYSSSSNVIRNCKVALSRTTSNSRGIYSLTVTGSANRDNTFQNNLLENMTSGVHIVAISTLYCSNHVVTGNTISDVTSFGVYLVYGDGCEISGNVITMASGNSVEFRGVHFGGSTATVQISGNSITGANATGAVTGIYQATGTANIYDNVISGFTVSNSNLYGVYMGSGTAGNTYRNHIHSLTGNRALAGIKTATDSGTLNIYSNQIHGLLNNYTSTSYYCVGIEFGGVLGTVYNNMIYDLNSTCNVAAGIRGIMTINGTTLRMWHNSVFIKAGSSLTGFSTAALYISHETPTIELINNIFVNLSTPGSGTSGRSVALWKSSAGFTKITDTSDRNIYHAGTPGAKNLICYAGTNAYQTLSDYKEANPGKDQGSFTEEVPFISVIDPVDLHIRGDVPTRVEGNAMPLAAVTMDIDLQSRNAATPDIGADEGDFLPFAQLPHFAILPIPLNGAIAQSPAITLNWAASTEGGVATGYKMYLGTDGGGVTPPTDILDGVDLGLVFSYDPDPDLAYLTTFYWQVVPYNAGGDADDCPIWTFNTHDLPLTGTKTIGSGGYYQNFTEAILHLNGAGVGNGGVTYLVAAGETFVENPPAITATGTSSNPILFRSDEELRSNPLITPSGGSGTFGIKIEGGDYITFNGIDIANAEGQTNLVYGYWVQGMTADGCNNITITSCQISLSLAVTSYGIYSASPSGVVNSYLTIHQNSVDNATNAIYVNGVSGSTEVLITANNITNTVTGIYLNYGTNCSITENQISFATGISNNVTGIHVQNATSLPISGNTISGGSTSGSARAMYVQSGTSQWTGNTVANIHANATCSGWEGYNGTHSIIGNDISGLSSGVTIFGLDLSSGSSQTMNVTASRNRVHNISTTTGSSYLCYGIFRSGSGTAHINNNYVYDLRNPGGSSSPQVRAIGITSGTLTNVYYNTVYLNSTGTHASHSSATLYVSGGTTIKLGNNIFVNATTPGINGRIAAFWKTNAGFTNISDDSDRNIYYAGTPDAQHLICYLVSTGYPTLDEYKAANPGKDQGSFTENMAFMSAIAPYDLHIDPSQDTRAEGNALPIDGITTDWDGDLRNASTPDIGADEGDFIPYADVPAPALAYSPQNNAFVVLRSATLSWIPSAAGGIPTGYRIYFGTDNPPTNIENGTDLADVLMYDPNPDMQYLTTYYWQIVPYNELGEAQGCPVWQFDTLEQPLTGVRTIGTGGQYPSFTLAITHLNASGVGNGGVTFDVAADETFVENPPPITAVGSAANPILFRNDGSMRANPVITPSGGSGTYGIKISGGDYITFDGIDIANTSSATNLTYGYWIAGSTNNGAQYITIRNCAITLSRVNTASVGIYSYGSTNGTSNYLLIQGNTIDDVNTGILLTSNGAHSTGVIVEDNDITNVSAYGINHQYGTATHIRQNRIFMANNNTTAFSGIYGSNTGGSVVVYQNTITGATTNSGYYGIQSYYGNNQWYENEVTGFTNTGSAACYGIYSRYNSPSFYDNHIHNLTAAGHLHGVYVLSGTTITIRNNLIHNLAVTGSTQLLRGLTVDGGTTVSVYNNMVYDLRNPGSSTTPQVRGLDIISGNTTNVYYNSILLTASGSNANFSSAALYVNGGTTNRFKNNIFTNLSTPGANGYSVAYWKSTAGFTNISLDTNNNIYYAGIPDANRLICYHVSTPYQEMDAYLAANPGKDQSSFSEAVPFISTTAPFDLHLRDDVETRAEGNALVIAGIDTDFDGDARHTSRPDIGADEGDFTPISGPPAAPILLSPANNAVYVSLVLPLTWAPGGGGLPTEYEVYFGTSDPPAYAATLVQSSYQPVMEPETVYYWCIKSINSFGDATSAVWSFTTRDDYTIYDIPFAEGFETGNTHGSTSVSRWTQALGAYSNYWTGNTATTYNRTPRSGSFNVTLSASGNSWLIRPIVLQSGITYELSMWARQSLSNTAYANLKAALGASIDPASFTYTFLPQTGIINGAYQNIKATFSVAIPGTYYLGIQGIVTNAVNYISLDDIDIHEYQTSPIFGIDPTTWNFGNVDVGETGTEKAFVISNSGDGDLIITLDNLLLTGTDAMHFQMIYPEDDILIPPAQTHTLWINFVPLTTGHKYANLQITDNSATRATYQVPLTGRGMGPLDPPFVMDFELGWEDWVAVNGSQSSQWHIGTATSYRNANSVYVSTNNGAANAYNTGFASVAHFYHDVRFPEDMSQMRLLFNWKGMGEVNYDFMTVRLIDPAITPVAGTPLTTGQIGTMYQGSSDWQFVSIDLDPSLAGSIKRLVFSWRNDSGGGTQPPAAIDNIRILGIVPAYAVPLNIGAYSSANNAVITWDAVPDANEYLIEEADMYDGSFQYLGRSGQTSFSTPAPYGRRFYRVRATD